MDKERDTVIAHHPSGDSAPGDDELCRLLLKLAHHHARRHGLTAEEAEDCAAEFALRMLQKQEYATRRDQNHDCFPAWLHRCAGNFARDFRRARSRRQHHEQIWPETIRHDGTHHAWDCPDHVVTPESELLRSEFWTRMRSALNRLPPIMREMLVRHHLHGACVQELAAATGRTPEAVVQTLFRARRRMRALLERMGLSEAELRAYIVISSPLHTRCLSQPLSADDSAP